VCEEKWHLLFCHRARVRHLTWAVTSLRRFQSDATAYSEITRIVEDSKDQCHIAWQDWKITLKRINAEIRPFRVAGVHFAELCRRPRARTCKAKEYYVGASVR
jgi:hypothetical protein